VKLNVFQSLALFVLVTITFTGIAIACTSYKGTELKDGKTMIVKRDKFAGIVTSEVAQELYTDSQVQDIARVEIAAAETEAKKETVLFDIKKKQNREQLKQSVSKWVSFACFGLAIAAMAFAAFTKGYARWGVVAAVFFVSGMVSLLIPEFSDYLKWVVVAVGAVAIILALSHTKNWHIGKSKEMKEKATSGERTKYPINSTKSSIDKVDRPNVENCEFCNTGLIVWRTGDPKPIHCGCQDKPEFPVATRVDKKTVKDIEDKSERLKQDNYALQEEIATLRIGKRAADMINDGAPVTGTCPECGAKTIPNPIDFGDICTNGHQVSNHNNLK